MLSSIRSLVDPQGLRSVHRTVQRNGQCRRNGHSWTVMAYPPACSTCGRTQAAGAATQQPIVAA